MHEPIWISLPGGRDIDLLDLSPSDFRIEDIANTLAKVNRFGGHTPYPYSVAQHSVNIVKLVPPRLRKAAFAHDFSEYLVTDMVTPIKNQCPDFREIEDPVQKAIFQAFGLNWSEMGEIHAADKYLGQLEWQYFFRGSEFTMGCDFTEKSWSKACDEFLQMYWTLFGNRVPASHIVTASVRGEHLINGERRIIN